MFFAFRERTACGRIFADPVFIAAGCSMPIFQSMSAVLYLTEDPSHDAAIALINDEAFGPGRFVRAAERIREQGPHDRALSFVASDGGDVVASVRMTPVMAGPARAIGMASAGAVAGHLLGPLAVRPSHKNRGIGRELVRLATRHAFASGSQAVILVGDPPYYAPLGFQPVPERRLRFPGPVDPQRILVAPARTDILERIGGVIHHRSMAAPSILA